MRLLRIEGARPEFLVCDTTASSHGYGKTTTTFPKLEILTIHSMPNWEEWAFDAMEGDGGRGTTIRILSHL